MPVSPARAAAFDILLRVGTTDAYASELLHSSGAEKLSPADHGLATEIVMGVLRWRSVLDEQIATYINQRPAAAKAAKATGTPPARLQAGPYQEQSFSKLDIEVITALRMGAYQLLFLDRIPPHAAINESVELVKKARKRSAAGMVNAVLRKINPSSPHKASGEQRSDHAKGREGIASAMPTSGLGSTPLGAGPVAAEAAVNSGRQSARLQAVPSRLRLPKPESLHSTHNERAHPAWMVERWKKNYGGAAQAVCSYDQQTPSTVIRADAKVIKELATDGIQLDPGRLLKNARVVMGGDITRTRAFRDKRLTIQDEGSQLIALLLGHGQRILDCCAAPGGKTRVIAEQNPHAMVIATELHPHRAALVRRLVPLTNVHVISADARQMPLATRLDRILVDAPCTGTGTLARNPDIKWRLTPEDITRMQAYQLEILSAAMQQLTPGGQLVYSTCSLEPEENEVVIERALQDTSGFRLLAVRDRLVELRREGELVCDPDSLVRGEFLRTISGVHHCDGFFAALLEREM